MRLVLKVAMFRNDRTKDRTERRITTMPVFDREHGEALQRMFVSQYPRSKDEYCETVLCVQIGTQMGGTFYAPVDSIPHLVKELQHIDAALSLPNVDKYIKRIDD